MWTCLIDVKDVSEEYIEKAKKFDGEDFTESAFVVEAHYNEINGCLYGKTKLNYICFDGRTLYFDYTFTDEELKYILECIRKEIG